MRLSVLAHRCEATESPKVGELKEFARGRGSPSVRGDQENFISKDKAWLSLAECSRTSLAQNPGQKQHVHRGRKNIARVETEPGEGGKN